MRIVEALAAAVLGVSISGCATSTAPGVTGVSRTQLLLMPAATINNQAALGYSKMSSDARNVGRLNSNEALTVRARGIANRLIAEVGVFRADAVSWGWEVNVFDSEELNATCWPGGKIRINTGLITRLKLTDDELAVVVGHEIAHALREHGREKMSQQVLSSAVVNAIANSRSRYANTSSELAKYGAQFFVHLPFSRDMELEADVLGLELMARAGFDPSQATSLWRKMKSQGGSASVEFFNTHPDHDRRIAELESVVPKVQPYFEASAARRAYGSNAQSPPVAAEAAFVQASLSVSTPVAPAIPTTLVGPNASAAAVRRVTDSEPIGRDSYVVERMARQEGCAIDPRAVLTSKGPGYEAYTLVCRAGETWSVRCEFGNCRISK